MGRASAVGRDGCAGCGRKERRDAYGTNVQSWFLLQTMQSNVLGWVDSPGERPGVACDCNVRERVSVPVWRVGAIFEIFHAFFISHVSVESTMHARPQT